MMRVIVIIIIINDGFIKFKSYTWGCFEGNIIPSLTPHFKHRINLVSDSK